jgi:hypothetical protein
MRTSGLGMTYEVDPGNVDMYRKENAGSMYHEAERPNEGSCAQSRCGDGHQSEERACESRSRRKVAIIERRM